MPLMLLLAAATLDPAAIAALTACRDQAAATHRPCSGRWASVDFRLDADLRGTFRPDGKGPSATWQVDCPYDVVRRSGACAVVAGGVMLLRTYGGSVALVWGDRNAERRERTITFDGTRHAGWTDDMTPEDTTRVLSLLEQSRRATFGWRAARATTMTTTTIGLAGFGDVETLLAAAVEIARRVHQPG